MAQSEKNKSTYDENFLRLGGRNRARKSWNIPAITLFLCAAMLVSACKGPGANVATERCYQEPVALASADVIKLSFAGMPELNQLQKVRADGKISLPMIGEYNVAGKTPGALQQEISHAYQTQLQNCNVVVALENTSATAYISGAVVKPGKIVIDRPMTAFEAIMEAGGFEPGYANMKRVVVLRNENGRQCSQVLDLSPALKGRPFVNYYIKPHDVVFVPQSYF